MICSFLVEFKLVYLILMIMKAEDSASTYKARCQDEFGNVSDYIWEEKEKDSCWSWGEVRRNGEREREKKWESETEWQREKEKK